jgi:hypothetical protein
MPSSMRGRPPASISALPRSPSAIHQVVVCKDREVRRTSLSSKDALELEGSPRFSSSTDTAGVSNLGTISVFPNALRPE